MEDITVTADVIRSFEHRNAKGMVLRVSPLLTVDQLIERVNAEIQKQPRYRPYRAVVFDRARILQKAHGAKPNTVYFIDMSAADLPGSATLTEAGVENETQLSVYISADYAASEENLLACSRQVPE